MHKLIKLLLLTLLTYNDAGAQTEQQKIRGKIISLTTNLPVANAEVRSRRIGTITLTGADGSFALVFNQQKDTLDISSTGYETQTIPVNPQTTLPLTISLTALTKNLEEVTVNTGYQKIPKERATGSFVTISKSLFNQQTGTTVLARLESIANGLYFDRQTGTGNNIVIRGLSTIQGPRSPLIILDNFPYEGDLNNINPNDVENITILKDAAAASIWGSRAGNGVIVITTKQGKYDQPVKIDISSNVQIIDKPRLGYVKDISPSDFIDVERFLYSKGYYNAQLSGQPWVAISPAVEILKQRDLGNISAANADEQLEKLGTHKLTDELSKYIYQRGRNFQQAISLRGGFKNFAWNLGGGWDHNEDVLTAKYERFNFRSNQSFKLSGKLEITTGIDYTQTNTGAGRLGYGQLRPKIGYLPVYTQLASASGAALPVLYEYRKTYTDTAGAGKLLDWNWYPLNDNNNIDVSSRQQAVIANVGINYSIRKNLVLGLKYQYGRQVSNDESVYSKDSYYARNLVNSFSSIDATGKVSYAIPAGGVRNDAAAVLRTQNIRGQINYSKQWRLHEISALAGAEYRGIDVDNSSYRSYGYNPNILLATSVNYAIQYPNYLSGVKTYIPDGTGYSGTVNHYVSFFSNAAYTYKERYTISVSGRRDASNLFGATNNNRWTPLWSAGMGWDINKEQFYRFMWLPTLKVRISFGVSGNADPLRSAVTTLQFNSNSKYTQLPIARISQFPNPGLSWEKVAMTNVAVDFASKGNRISGSIEYYHKKGTNLFGTSPVDYTGLAFNSVIKNVAMITGQGLDIGLNSNNLIGRIKWSSQLNLNFTRDKVLKYYLADMSANNFIGGKSISALEGRPVYALYDYKWAGLDPATGDPQGFVNSGVSKNYDSLAGTNVLITDLKYIGPTLPTAVISLGNTISWKNLSVSVRITGKFGNYFQRPSINYRDLFINRLGHTDYGLRWQQPGDEMHTNVPSMVYPLNQQREIFYAGAEVLATKADFIRLQYVTVSYQLKKPSIVLNANVNNLGILWRANKYGIDPEYISGLPPSINYSLGIRATF